MLELNGVPFTVGRSRFVDAVPDPREATAKVYVKIVPQALGQTILAQLDTGAPWCIFEPELAAAINILDSSTDQVTLETRFGKVAGHLERVELTILADQGESLDVEATVFVSKNWPAGLNFLGYSGLLERLRIALDPHENFFYFGPLP